MVDQLEKLLPRHMFYVFHTGILKRITQRISNKGMKSKHMPRQVQGYKNCGDYNEHSGSFVLITCSDLNSGLAFLWQILRIVQLVKRRISLMAAAFGWDFIRIGATVVSIGT